MMKFHPSSFLMGLASAAALVGARQHLRPVVVEVAALGVQLGRLGLALVERQREHLEDLWAEIDERVRAKQGAPRPVEARDERPSRAANGVAAAA